MTTMLHDMSIETFVPMLGTLSALLDKAAEHARAKGFDPDTLAEKRLAPDMFPLPFQIYVACDHAASAAARLTGREPPKSENTDKTIAEMQARIARTRDYLMGATAQAMEGAETRIFEIPLQGPMKLELNGLQLLRDWHLPNFYFHLVTAYDILRHEGVALGKKDYMAHIAPYIRQG